MEKIFEIQNLQVEFPLGSGFLSSEKGSIHAVNGINLNIFNGEILSIVGESGCGKSTFARAILGLEKPTDGQILYKGKNIKTFTKAEKHDFRKQCQFVFQNPFSSLNPRMSIFEILKEPLVVNGIRSKSEINDRIIEAVSLVGLDKEALVRFPHEFSGGQLQRLAIARALILKPQVIVADEPVSALDVSIQAQIINLLLELKEKLNLTIVFISHDLGVVRHISDRVAVMYLGEIVELAKKSELFAFPLHPYTRALLEAVPQVKLDKPTNTNVLQGDLPSVKDLPTGCYLNGRCAYSQPICQSEHPEFFSFSETHIVRCHHRVSF